MPSVYGRGTSQSSKSLTGVYGECIYDVQFDFQSPDGLTDGLTDRTPTATALSL